MWNRVKMAVVVAIGIVALSVLCVGCNRTVEWKAAAYVAPEGTIDGICVYVDERSVAQGSTNVSIAIVNESNYDLAFGEMDESAIQKMINGEWCVVDLGERQRTSELKYTVISQGKAICETLDTSYIAGGLTAGEYRVGVCMYFLDDMQEVGDKFYIYYNFGVE